jgi:hypothetical protein
LWGRQVARALSAGGLCAFVCRRSPAHCEAFRPPGRGAACLESGGCLRLSPGRGVGDASWELAPFHRELPPGDGGPCLPMMGIMAPDGWTLLVDSPCVRPVPLGASPAPGRGPWLRGRARHTSRLRVGGGLRRGESVRGFPSPWVTLGALWRGSRAAGGRCGGRRQAGNCLPLWPGLLPRPLGLIVLCGPRLSWAVTRSRLVQLGCADDGFQVASLALPRESFAWWLTSVRLGRCLPFHPCARLSTRSPRGWLTLSTSREGMAPSGHAVEVFDTPASSP